MILVCLNDGSTCFLLVWNGNRTDIEDHRVKHHDISCLLLIDMAEIFTVHLPFPLFFLGSRLWWFQVCSEVAYFQVAPKNDSVRSAQVNTRYCAMRFYLSMY